MQLSGVVKQVRAASATDRSQFEIVFTQISYGVYRANLAAILVGLDNAREKVDDKGVINGIDGAETYSSRLNQGIEKLQNNDRFAGLAGLIQGAKQALKIQDANPNIDYDPGVEMTLRLTAALDWRGPVAGPEAKLLPFPDQNGLIRLVNSQPYRTVAAQPPRPSDMTNLMFIGTEAELRAAFEKAGGCPRPVSTRSRSSKPHGR